MIKRYFLRESWFFYMRYDYYIDIIMDIINHRLITVSFFVPVKNQKRLLGFLKKVTTIWHCGFFQIKGENHFLLDSYKPYIYICMYINTDLNVYYTTRNSGLTNLSVNVHIVAVLRTRFMIVFYGLLLSSCREGNWMFSFRLVISYIPWHII